MLFGLRAAPDSEPDHQSDRDGGAVLADCGLFHALLTSGPTSGANLLPRPGTLFMDRRPTAAICRLGRRCYTAPTKQTSI